MFGAAVLLSGDANLFMTINPAGTIATVLTRASRAVWRRAAATRRCTRRPDARDGRGGGGGPGREHGRVPARLQAVFHGFCAAKWRRVPAMRGAGVFMIVGFVGINFLLELGVNIVLAPVISRLIRLGKKA